MNIDKIKYYIKSIFEIIRKNEMRILPGNLAFFVLLSIPPLLTLIGLIGAQFSSSLEVILNFISNTLPKDVVNLLFPILNNVATRPSNMIIYLILGFITASNGANSLIISSNTLYDVEGKNSILRKIKS